MDNINEKFVTKVKANDTDAVTALLKSGANVNACDYSRRTALEISVGNGNLDMVIKLLGHGADMHPWDNYALWLSIKRNHLEITTVLLENGANVYRDNKGILKDLQKNFNKQIADLVLPYCDTSDYEYFPLDYIRSRLVPTKSANSVDYNSVVAQKID